MAIGARRSFANICNTAKDWAFISRTSRLMKIGPFKMPGAMLAIKSWWKKASGMIAQNRLLKSWRYAKAVSKKSKRKTLKDRS